MNQPAPTGRKCPICTHVHPALEEHHVIPREFGGEKGPTINICGSCHNGLHSTARNILSGAKPKIYFDEATLKRAMPFVQRIITSQLVWEEKNDRVQLRRMIVEGIEGPLLARIHQMKMDAGFTNLSDFVKHVFRQMAQQRI